MEEHGRDHRSLRVRQFIEAQQSPALSVWKPHTKKLVKTQQVRLHGQKKDASRDSRGQPQQIAVVQFSFLMFFPLTDGVVVLAFNALDLLNHDGVAQTLRLRSGQCQRVRVQRVLRSLTLESGERNNNTRQREESGRETLVGHTEIVHILF